MMCLLGKPLPVQPFCSCLCAQFCFGLSGYSPTTRYDVGKQNLLLWFNEKHRPNLPLPGAILDWWTSKQRREDTIPFDHDRRDSIHMILDHDFKRWREHLPDGDQRSTQPLRGQVPHVRCFLKEMERLCSLGQGDAASLKGEPHVIHL